ncbi:MAG TPA: efflux RND transporter periplasmic adaptor subunit [Chitinophagaceae bacterium]|nr:efflux RND transporter periplasmic adaptor subunit [Chitinophagaceae bacterium]
MYKYILSLVGILSFVPLWAHDGDDHAAAGKGAKPTATAYFSVEAFSDKYEALLKYGTIAPGRESSLKLYLAEFNSNRPIDSADVKVTVSGAANLPLKVVKVDKGIYELTGIFPARQAYNLNVSINARLGADLLQLTKVEIGKEFSTEEDTVHAHWYGSNWFFAIMGLIAGLLIMFLLMKRRNQRTITGLFIGLCLFPTAANLDAVAHDGHDDKAKASGTLSNAFIVQKETQFLFNILTQKLTTGDFNETSTLLGTVVPAPAGQAVIQSPQVGKIVSLKVNPGQQVSRGQVLAVIEQQVDAGTQIDIISQRNTIDAEYQAAKAQYERLKSIEDIAAKKDLTEAKARYDAARRNKQLFDANAGRNAGSSKLVTLTSPISGVVGTFNYAIGAVVNAGQTLFEVTNLSNVYVEAQLFAADADKLKSATRFTVSPVTNDTAQFAVRLVSGAQSVNQENQAQRVIFQLMSPSGQFRIGENINLRVYSNTVIRKAIIPSEAITEVNGRPAVFIKDKAEVYSISFISAGQTNGKYTVISKGAEEGERIVTQNVYQMKTMYLNQ